MIRVEIIFSYDYFHSLSNLWLLDAAVQLANWDPSKFREKLCHDIDRHASSVQNEKLSGMIASYEVNF